MSYSRYTGGIAAVVPAAILLACVTVPRIARGAVDTNTAQLFVEPNFSGGTGPYSQTVSQVGPITLNGSANDASNSSGQGMTHVDYGIIKLSGEFNGSGGTLTRGTYTDLFNITSPTVPNGTAGTYHFSISVDGTLNVPIGGGYASYSLTGNIGGGIAQINVSGSQNASETTGNSFVGSPLGTFVGTVGFIYGNSMTLTVELDGTADVGYTTYDVSNGVTPSANFDLAHSSYWQGITDVTASGAPVSDFVVSSASGANYANSFAPVPEPTTAALLLPAAFLLRRRRRSQSK